MRRLFFCLLCGCAWLQGSFAAVQVGIVSLDERSQTAGDLLTARLSHSTNVALLERNEVDKALRERALISSQHMDFAGLGQLLHADGLILGEIVSSPVSTNLAVRLVAVNSGVVLDAMLYPYPLPEPERWAKIAADRLTPLLPKLAVQKGQAIPISILNLHAAVSTPESQAVERALNTLLFHRLVLERDVFVLERRQLGRAEWEKKLALDESRFWSGGYLLEGVIDRDGTSDRVLTINARLIPPGKGSPISIDISVPQRDLPATAELLAQKIMAALQRTSAVALWDRNGEAERFEQEGVWSLRWEMWPEAYADAESAWALGRHTEAIGSLQLRALLPQIVPDDVWVDNVWIAGMSGKGRISNVARNYDPARNAAWTTNVAPAADVKLALEAAGVYARISHAPEANWQTRKTWLDLGTNVLAKISGVIRHQYLYGWHADMYDTDLPALREAARTLAAGLPRERVACLELGESSFWQDIPLAAFESYKLAMQRGEFDDNPAVVFSRDAYNPLWVAWTPSDRQRGAQQWRAFIADLLNSTNRAARVDAALFNLHEARFDPDIALAFEQFMDNAMDSQRSRFSTNVSYGALDCFDLMLRNKAQHPATLRRARLLDTWRGLEFPRLKHYLQTARTHVPDRAEWPYASHVFTQDEARELLPVVDEYTRRIGKDLSTVRTHLVEAGSKPTDPFEAFLANPVFDRERFRHVFAEHEFTPAEAARLAFAVRAYANRNGWNDDLSAMDARLQKMLPHTDTPPTNEAARSTSAVLKLTQRLQATFVDNHGEPQPIALGPWVEHQGKLIMIGIHPRVGTMLPAPADGPHPIELDPLTGKSRMLPQVMAFQTYGFLAPKFQVIGDALFWIKGESTLEALEMHSPNSHTYEVNLPLRQAELVTLSNRLFIADADYIAEFSLRDHTVHLLASKRRKPAATQLDNWPGWSGKTTLWLDRQGALFSNVGGTNVWKYEDATQSWRQWRGGSEDLPWTFSFSHSSMECQDYRTWIDGSRQLILGGNREKLPFWPMPYDYPLTPGLSVGQIAGQHAFDGTNLWILARATTPDSTPGNRISMITPTDRDMTLLYFDPHWEMPIEIPLVFDRNGQPAPRFAGLSCIPIRDGLIFTLVSPMKRADADGWFIPWPQLHQWVAQNQRTNHNLPRSEPERRLRFDLNHNGVLDPQEVQAMDALPSWREEDECFETRRLLFTFDADHDGKLGVQELRRMVSFANQGNLARNPEQGRSGWSPRFEPNQLLQGFDGDHDRAINEAELVPIFRKIRSERVPQPGEAGGMRFPPMYLYSPSNFESNRARKSP